LEGQYEFLAYRVTKEEIQTAPFEKLLDKEAEWEHKRRNRPPISELIRTRGR
jgi:hypothetical protein